MVDWNSHVSICTYPDIPAPSMRCFSCKRPIDGIVGGCKRCGKAFYCSEECQRQDWGDSHYLVCERNSWEDIGGKFTLFDKNTPPPTDAARLVYQSPESGYGAELLAQIYTRLGRVIYDDGWKLAQDMFSSMRIILTGIRSKAVIMLSKTRADLNEAAWKWSSMKGLELPRIPPAPRPPLFEQPKTALDAWKKDRAEDTRPETAIDRLIIYLIDRETSLERVISSANLLLGPPDVVSGSQLPRMSPGRASRLTPVVADFMRENPLMGIGMNEWNPENPGIYLNFDWDEDRQAERNQLLSLKTRKDRDLPSDTHRLVRAARVEWIRAFQRDLYGLSTLIGLDDIKGQIATFIQTLIVNPIYARTGALFMNIAIMGEAGTGKTEVAKRLPGIFYRLGYAPFPYANGDVSVTDKSSWVAPYEGQSSHQARMQMLAGLGRVIVFDEAYSLVTDDSDGFGKESLAQIVKDLDEFRGLVMFVILGYEEGIRQLLDANAGMYRRFPNLWTIRPYTAKDLVDILFYSARNLDFTVIQMEAEKERGNLESVMQEFIDRGILTDLNAGAIQTIMGIYRGIYAKERFARGGSLREESPVLNMRILFAALGNFAAARGLNLWYDPEGDDNDDKGKEEMSEEPAPRRQVVFQEPEPEPSDKDSTPPLPPMPKSPPPPTVVAPSPPPKAASPQKAKYAAPPDPPRVKRAPRKKAVKKANDNDVQPVPPKELPPRRPRRRGG